MGRNRFVVLVLVMLVCIGMVSAGNYKFQNTTGSTLMIINGTNGNVGIGGVYG